MNSISDGVQLYLDEMRDIFKTTGLQDPFIAYPRKFNEEIGHLLDPSKHSYNRNGQVDLLRNDLMQEISKVRFAVANTLLFKTQGLAPFVFERKAGVFRPKEIDLCFFYFVDSSFIHFYTAWGRIAHLLALFFNVKDEEKKSDFADIMDYLNSSIGS